MHHMVSFLPRSKEVNLKQPDGSYLKIMPENRAARVVDGVIYNLPEYEEGTILIVSHITQKTAGGRRDLMAK